MASILSLMNAKILFKIQGPAVRASNRISIGPANAEISVVSQGEALNREAYHEEVCSSCSLSFSLLVSIFMLSLITPEWLA